MEHPTLIIHYPQSNGRAEAGVKTSKRILLGNVNPVTGKLDNEAAVRALLTHRNTPSQQTGVSPACALFGRPLRDHLPLADLHLRKEWTEVASKREEALAKRHIYTTKITGFPCFVLETPSKFRTKPAPDLQNGIRPVSSPKSSLTASIG